MKTYTVKEGDTLDLISRLQYGTENDGFLIKNANPALVADLIPGQVLSIPEKQGLTQLLDVDVPVDTENQVSITINNRQFTFFEDISISRRIDSLDSFSFTAPFEPSDDDIRETFKPFTYQVVKVYVGEKIEFTGIMFVAPQVSDVRTMGITGYALPGVLTDCPAPISSYPIEFNGSNLKEIATALLSPFGLSTDFRSGTGAAFTAFIFERVAPKETQKILPYLTGLAQQRGQIISNDEAGRLVFQTSIGVGNPVARLTDSSSPVLSIATAFTPQKFYSSISGISPSSEGNTGGSFTVQNKLLDGVLRPFTYKASDSDDSSLSDGVKYKAGLMVGQAIRYNVTMNTWRDPQGDLWKPNTTIVLKAESVMIYSDFEFLISGVSFARGVTGDNAVLELTLPGAYSGELPESLPWD